MSGPFTGPPGAALARMISAAARFRVLVAAAAVGLLLAGVLALRSAPASGVPELAPATVTVQTEALGLSGPEVEQLITVPLENNLLAGIMGVRQVRSQSIAGLSSIDLQLHFSTFTIPWQLAGLINLGGADRTLRFYVRQGEEMAECPYWVIHERD